MYGLKKIPGRLIIRPGIITQARAFRMRSTRDLVEEWVDSQLLSPPESSASFSGVLTADSGE
jgi:hypothetical protein